MLCERCQPIFKNSFPIDRAGQGKRYTILNSGVHHQDSDSFGYVTSKFGCHICQSLYRALPRDFASNLSSLDHPNGFLNFELFNPAADGEKLTLSFSYAASLNLPDEHASKRLDRGHKFFMRPVSGPFDPAIPYNGLDLSSNTGSKRALTLAADWTRSCNTSHVKCSRKKSGKQFFPTRLLDVGCKDAPSLRLCIRGEDPMAGGYATLSYCKAAYSGKKLLTFNLDEMRMSIEANELPKTFAEAVEVTRTLGLKYIWIDVLCIVQDSEDDRRREVSSMSEVFSETQCTIAATRSSTPDEGLFTRRNPFYYLRYAFLQEMETTTDSRQAYFLDDTHYWCARVDNSPLLESAWFVQERILSPRILHFTRDMIFWECKETSACEEFPVSIPFGRADDSKPTVPDELSINTSSMDPKQIGSHRYFWGNVVRSFTRASLANSDDKFDAISGVAKQVSKILKSPYLAGLWHCSLATDLLWLSSAWKSHCRPATYRAPSWSWASIDGPVYPGCWATGEELITLVDYGITPVSQDPFGHLKGAYLRLSGRLYPARARVHLGADGDMEVSFLDHFEPKKNGIVPDERPVLPEGQENTEMTVFVLPIIHCGERRLPSRVGIVLVQAENLPQGSYRRFGSYRAGYPESPNRMLGICPGEVTQNESWYEEGKPNMFCIV